MFFLNQGRVMLSLSGDGRRASLVRPAVSQDPHRHPELWSIAPEALKSIPLPADIPEPSMDIPAEALMLFMSGVRQ